MSVSITNRFGLLNVDDEPSVVKAPAKSAAPANATLMAMAKHNPPAKKEPRKDVKKPSNANPKNRQVEAERPLQVSEAPIDKPKGVRRNKEHGHGKPLRFDRKDKTGRVETEKKQYSGKGSWGKPTDQGSFDNASHLNQQVVATGEEPADENVIAAVEKAPAAPAVKTLDQYLAEKKKTNGSVPVLNNLRKVNEGVDSALLKDFVVFQRKEEVLVVGNSKNQKPADKKKN